MSVFTLFMMAACTQEPNVNVQVVDIWSAPIATATVVQEGVVERLAVDAEGKVALTAEAGDLHLKAGAEGYVQEITTVTVPAEAESPLEVKLSLFPEPKKNGFHGVGGDGYVPIKPVKVKTVAPSKKSHYHGIVDRPSAVVPGGDKQQFVFRTSLGLEELSSFELQLSSMEFKKKGDVVGVLGKTEVKLDLWVEKKDLEFDVKGMLNTRDNYLIVPKKPLKPGVYAFHAGKVMEADDPKALDRIPEELRVIYAFKVE